MVQCSQLAHHHSLDDIITFNDVEKECVERFNDTTMMMIEKRTLGSSSCML